MTTKVLSPWGDRRVRLGCRVIAAFLRDLRRSQRKGSLRLAWALCLLVVSARLLHSQPPSRADSSNRPPTPAASGPTVGPWGLPGTDHRGRPFRPLGVYQSQLVDLVPSHFRPVSVQELLRALLREHQPLADSRQARLATGFYDIRLDGRHLVSEHSELVIEHRADQTVRKSLGPVNLAILRAVGSARPQSESETLQMPQLEVDANGDLIATLPATRRSGESAPPVSAAKPSEQATEPNEPNEAAPPSGTAGEAAKANPPAAAQAAADTAEPGEQAGPSGPNASEPRQAVPTATENGEDSETPAVTKTKESSDAGESAGQSESAETGITKPAAKETPAKNGTPRANMPRADMPGAETSPEGRTAGEESRPVPWTTSKLRFGWTLRSDSVETLRKFELILPRTAQTRLVISTPADITLESAQGVLSQRPGPPPGADVQSRTGDIRWYLLEAGGLNRLELYARRELGAGSNRPLLIRRESKQYEIDLAGLRWKHRMTLELPRTREQLQLRVPLGTVTGVRLNSIQANYRLLRREDGQTLVDLDLPSRLAGSTQPGTNGKGEGVNSGATIDLVTLTVEGVGTWELGDGLCRLPRAEVNAPNLMRTQAATQAAVAVQEPLDVAQWNLPADWRQSVETSSREGETLLVAEGPPGASPQADASGWSQVRLVEKPERTIERIWSRLRVQQRPAPRIRCTSRVRCRLLQNRAAPLQLAINPDWAVDSLNVVGSGRQIPVVGSGNVTVWPTAEEASQDVFELQLKAHRNLPVESAELALPATWIIRPADRAAPQLISVEPPKLRRWDGNAVMLPGRIEASALDEEARAFFEPASETLLLRSPAGHLPAVALESVDVSFGVSLRHAVETEGDDVLETITVATETSQGLQELRLDTGDASPRPYDWSLRRKDGTTTLRLSNASVRRLPDAAGAYAIDLEGRDLRDYELIGRRYRPAQGQLTLSLASVRRARSQTAEVVIDSGWEVWDLPAGVQMVPSEESLTADAALGGQQRHFRYDPLLRSRLQLQRRHLQAMASLVWKQRVDVTAGSRTEDMIRLFAEVSSRKPIGVRFDQDLEVLAVSRNGEAYEPDQAVAGELTILPERQTDSITVVLRRRHQSSGWWRVCQLPSVNVVGHAVDRETFCRVGPDTLLLSRSGPLVSAAPAAAAPASDRLPAAEQLMLVPRHVALAIGWGTALAVMLIGWSLATWVPKGIQAVFVLLVVSLCAAVLWWPWQTAILGWIAGPLALAALLHVILSGRDRSAALPAEANRTPHVDQPASRRSWHGSSRHGSSRHPAVPRSGMLWWLLAVTLLAPAASGWAQSDGSAAAEANGGADGTQESDAGKPIELLVPLTAKHQPAGDKVYLADADYRSILQAVSPERPIDALFQSAEYRVALEAPRDSGEVVAAEIQADYRIRLVRETTRVRLPIRAETIRRIEIVTEDDAQIARFTVDQRGMVTVNVPPSAQTRLRITFVPRVSVAGGQGGSVPAGAEPPAAAAGEPSSGQASSGQPSSGQASSGQASSGPEDDPATEPERGDAESGQFDAAALEPDLATVRLGIPPIHSASLIVEAPREIVVESLGKPRGRALFRSSIGRYEADLGPARELAVTCRLKSSPGQPRQPAVRRAYRLVAGVNSTLVECEVAPMASVPEGETLQLTILGAPPDGLISTGWTMERPEQGDSGERLNPPTVSVSGGIYRFVKQSELDTPIRLMWRLPSILNDPTSTDDSKLMPVPEVFSSAANRAAPTLFAVESAASVRVSELASEIQTISTEDFLSQWRGYAGRLERAFVARDGFPAIVLLQNKSPVPNVTLTHWLHLAHDHMELGLRGEIVDLRSTLRRLLVSAPPGFRLLRCVVNGEQHTPVKTLTLSDPTARAAAMRRVLALGDQRVEGTMTFELVARRERPSRPRFPMPRFEILDADASEESYRVTRDRSVRVKWFEPDGSGQAKLLGPDAEDRSPSRLTEEDLLAGRVPVALLGAPQETELAVRSDSAGNSLNCRQTTLLRYSDGQWFCDTLLELPRRRIPAYIDVQLPSRWANELSVEGPYVWIQRESSDGRTTVVRVATAPPLGSTDGQREPSGKILITGSLDNRDQVRISVPEVTVLGSAATRLVVAVPKQLTTETISWQPRGVRPLQPRTDWSAAFGPKLETPELYSLYTADAPNWSIELEPISQATVDPVALNCDAKVMLASDHALVYQRFDLLPETRHHVRLALPPGASPLGAWVAGREIDLSGQTDNPATEREPAAAGKATPLELRLPLAYSRLPQPVEVFLKVSATRRDLDEYLARLADVPTTQVWVEYYRQPVLGSDHRLALADAPIPGNEDGGESRRAQRARRLALAESVVTVIDRSRDMLAERSNEEIAQWLLPWVQRYVSLARSDGRADALEKLLASREDGETENREADGDEETNPDKAAPTPLRSEANQEPSAVAAAGRDRLRRWQAMDATVARMAGRFLETPLELPHPLFAATRFPDQRRIAVLAVEGFAELPRLRPSYLPMKSLQTLLMNLITLLTFGLAVILLWPFRGRYQGWVREPAFWLFIFGAIGLFLAPPPIAITLMLVAVSVPVIRQLRLPALSLRQTLRRRRA